MWEALKQGQRRSWGIEWCGGSCFDFITFNSVDWIALIGYTQQSSTNTPIAGHYFHESVTAMDHPSTF